MRTIELLSPVRVKVMEAIEDFTDEKGYPPSMADIARRVDRSISAVWNHLVILRRYGFVSFLPDVARTIKIANSDWRNVREKGYRTTVVKKDSG
jgi:predicted transcriptional regulator